MNCVNCAHGIPWNMNCMPNYIVDNTTTTSSVGPTGRGYDGGAL